MVIVIAHQKGGVGKSTIAVNLAVELSKKKKITIIDLDYQKTLTSFNGIRVKNGLKSLDIQEFHSEKGLMKFIDDEDGDILIDCGGFDSKFNRIALIGADLIITPVSSSFADLLGLNTFIPILQDIKKVRPELKANILLNNIDPRSGKSVDELKKYISNYPDFFNCFDAVIRRRADYANCIGDGKSVIEMSKESKSAEEIRLILKEIKNVQK